MKTLSELIGDIEVSDIRGNVATEIRGITYDSRKVEPGFLFVCVEGFKTDGHNFVPAALEKGAAAIVGQRPVEVPEGVPLVLTPDTRKALALMGGVFAGHPSGKLIMIGVTGTNGKTTTTFLIEKILKSNGYKVGLIGTIMNKIGDRVYPVKNTTPESLDLQMLLKEMVDQDVTHTVMEVSSHALELDRVAGVEFDTAVFTNITQDHLDFHLNMENYLSAKTKLFSNLNRYSDKKRIKVGIINVDDASSQSLVQSTSGKVLTYGINNKADVVASNINLQAGGVSFDVSTPDQDFFLELKITGLFNVYNALAAICVGLTENIDPDDIKRALETVKGVPGRLEPVDVGQDFSVLVDYAHTPDGLENIIKAAREFTGGRVITVFGCGGDRDRKKRPIMGEIAGRLSDYSIVTSDNPRTEDPLFIVSEVESGVRKAVDRTRYSVIPDRREAIAHAVKMAEPGDVVLIAGKGHETYQIVGETVLHFDDREVARELLRSVKAGEVE